MLSEDDLVRYSRQIVYPHFGKKGQEKLKASHAVVVGVGGLGCAAALNLACAGIGRISLVDDDVIELSNLNRQILHWEQDVGERKTISAMKKLNTINSALEIDAVCEKITEDNVYDIIKGANVVINGLDDFETRFVVNSACVKRNVPFIHAGISGLLGQITTIVPGKTPCLSCMYPDIPPAEDTIPVFGVTPAFMASLQVAEAIKLLAGFGETLGGRMMYFDGETMETYYEDMIKDPNCIVCGSAGSRSQENR
ncbi:MAG: HesA/MoeB/ThiF family protein [Chloroflexota bacterium]|nr:HesA/MoeB/ThiF family protein [Chloroflexota bacterium]